MNNTEKASELFNVRRYHCSQAVFGAFAEELGIPEKLALKIGGCFGAGMNEGEVCGCVTGALMAVGLKYGQCSDDDMALRAKERELCMELYDRFRAENGSCICRDLLGYDFGKQEDLRYIQQTKLYLEICPKLVESAARIAAELMKDNPVKTEEVQ